MRQIPLANFDAEAGSAADRATNQLGEVYSVPILELFTQDFLSRHTRFTCLEAFIEASHLNPEQLPNLCMPALREWDLFVRASSNHPDWRTLLREAAGEWLVRRIGIIFDA